MIRIIRKGDIPEYENECRRCGSLFEFSHRDIVASDYILYGKLHTNKYIYCPVCKYKIDEEYFEKRGS